MRVNLIDIDQGFPNLALMKLSSYWKSQGAEVVLNHAKADYNFISCVFTWNKPEAERLSRILKATLGGSGVNGNILPAGIEHTCPDYDLYGINYSVGFTSRGCNRKCKFCIVPEKEGNLREWASLDEFVRHKRVILLDNNFLASPQWKDKVGEMIDRGLDIDFNQGLDIRILTEEKARLLTRLNPKYLRFAWDHPKLEDSVIRGIELLRNAGYPINRNRLGFYVLVGFDTTIQEDLYRLKYLHSNDINTHVQIYNNRRDNPGLRHLARWGNRPWLWKSCKWEEYRT